MDSVQEFVQTHRTALAIAVTSVAGLMLLKNYLRGGQCRSKVKLTGKTALVTGCNTGIGKETARDFANRGARVLIACRDVKKAEAAAKDIRDSTGNKDIVVYKLDLSSLDSVRKCAAEVNKKEQRLDILVNNAGVMVGSLCKTADGFEYMFGTNHLGHFLFTNLLLDLIKKSPPSRIVNVSSIAHEMAPGDLATKGMDFDNLNAEKEYDCFAAYGQSKLANILFTRELSRRLKGTKVTTNSLHPGAIRSDLARHMSDYPIYYRIPLTIWYHFGGKYLIKNVRDGAQTNIYLAVSEEVENVTGKYFCDCAIKEPSRGAQDDVAATRLWEVSEKMVGLKE